MLPATAQERDWSFELGYPISVGASFGSSNEGVVAVRMGYRFAALGKVRLGGSLGAAWFATTFINDSDPVQELEYRDFFLQPRIFGEMPISQNGDLRLRGGLGWTWQRSKGERFVFGEGEVAEAANYSGPDISLGLTYDLAPRWYLQAQYELLWLSRDAPTPTIALLVVGAGFRF
jgi:hypothetical protein